MKEINDEYSSQAGYPFVPELSENIGQLKEEEKTKWIVESVKIVLKNLLWKNQ